MMDRRLLVLWLTGKCNLRCRYCYAADSSAEDMTFETAKKAIGWMQGANFKVQFAGGEPLLNLSLMKEILEYLAQEYPNTACSVQTNAALITEEAAALFKKYHVAVGVSMDGSPERNERLRGKTKEAINGIQILRKHGIMVNLNAVVTAENVLHLADLVDLALYLGNVGGIGLDLLRYAGRAKEGAVQRASAKQLEEGLLLLRKRLDYVNTFLDRPLIVREFEKASYYLETEAACKDYCYASQGKSFVVLPDGTCYPCGSLAGMEQYNMGNVHSTVHSLRINCERPEKCRTCVYQKACSGGCPSRGLLNGGFDELDCLMKIITFQFAEDAKRRRKKNEKN